MEQIEKRGTKNLLNLHISEYNALTTRQTYYMSMQIVLIAAALAWPLVFVSIWHKGPDYLVIWCFIFGWQIIDLMIIFCFYDSFLIVLYLENKLKPKIGKLINSDNFWGYHPFLSKKRGRIYSSIELFNIIGVIVLFTFVIKYQCKTWTLGDWIGLVINIVPFIFLIKVTYNSIKTRFEILKV
jgi:hypothetical protein